MAESKFTVTLSATEMPQFRRLVDFLMEVDALADDRVDLELQDLVEGCQDDLLRMRRD